MSHRRFFLILALGNLILFVSLLCQRSGPFGDLSVDFPDDGILAPMDPEYLPRHVRQFAVSNDLFCYTDGHHHFLTSGREVIRRSDLYRASALLQGARGGNVQVVDWLMDRGMDPNVIDCQGNTPLQLALDRHHAPIARILLQNGADARFGAFSL